MSVQIPVITPHPLPPEAIESDLNREERSCPPDRDQRRKNKGSRDGCWVWGAGIKQLNLARTQSTEWTTKMPGLTPNAVKYFLNQVNATMCQLLLDTETEMVNARSEEQKPNLIRWRD